MKKRISLRHRLAFSITALLTGSLIFALVGTYYYLGVEELKFEAALSPEAYDAFYYSDWEKDGLPPQPILEEIAMAQVIYLDPSYENEFWVFVLLSGLAVVVGGGLAWFLSKRLTEPLEIASASAKVIADGDFSHKMKISGKASSEIASLGESVNYLSSSLRKMEDNVRYTSASIAHELRTPLTVIQGYIQGIQDGVFKADDEQLTLILDQVEGLSRLIDDLKLISLAEAHELVIHRREIDLRECINEAVNFMRPQFERADRKIDFQTSPAEVTAYVDPERIKQTLIALISNALRYGGANGSCQITCIQHADSTLVTVSNQGSGFSDEALERAADRFWRGDRSRAKESGGSGLGLAVVKAIVKAHDGALELSNQEGGGAIVTITVPRPS